MSNFVTNDILKQKDYIMIEFKPVTIEDKEFYESHLQDGNTRGCEFSFANLYLWGSQNIATLHDHIVLFSRFNRLSVYPYPIGTGDKKPVLDAIIADARERGIPCRISGLNEDGKQIIEDYYPGKFRFRSDPGSHDYVYDINDLADLGGRKYQRKRNHYHRFCKNFPEHSVEPLSENNISRVKQMVKDWYRERLQEDPEGDYEMEQIALAKALDHYNQLDMESLVLLNGDDVFAVTLGSRLSKDTFDVHFEKARSDIDGAYTAINRSFAQYIRSKFPEIHFLDREEDMGLEGLRKAKQSYYPHHMVEKSMAVLLEADHED